MHEDLVRVSTSCWNPSVSRTAGVARASLLEASVDLSALVLPPEMSSPERLKKDMELSAKARQLAKAN